ncbi:VWA domain-containing protein [Caldivirga maquilingensis]|uniref:von Willebrand factor type A n=1 Tax=Caldivirga maquilingensis (strain ATCC 700844 / DSM 13496 / JCM 10307 / IC-167) TaxID=397948 RepID=A8M9M1_CALMQ|nr:VWA domain-containing protein [Caldivirga maquilingensis]ABW00902.1 von Willebrand factor type A [Caldivirga maquilingensis IC-167]
MEGNDIEKFISMVLSRVYQYLVNHRDVVSPGSVRSYEYALRDIVANILISGGGNIEERLIRVGVENLYTSVNVNNGADKREILEEAFKYALSLVNDLNMRNDDEINTDEEGLVKGNVGKSQLSPNNDSKDGGTGQLINQELGTGNESSDDVANVIYDVFYGSVGTMNFINLAQLLNMFVNPMAHITEKVKVLRKLARYLASYGLLPHQGKGGSRVFKALDNVAREPTIGNALRVSRFTEHSNYPTYITGVREYRIGDPAYRIDLDKTSMNMVRKTFLNKPMSTRDIVVREYADVKLMDIVLCLDTSGSMKEFSGAYMKMDIAKEAIVKYIRYLSRTNDRLSMVLFNFRADILWGPHSVKKYINEMEEMSRYIYPGGGTNIANALEKARIILSKSNYPNKHIICITDGRTVNASSCIKEAVKLRRMGVTLSTVAVGDNSDFDLLMRLSKIGNGLFIKINDISNLDKALIMDKLGL